MSNQDPPQDQLQALVGFCGQGRFHKALNEFCAANNCTYEAVAISFYTKQVAARLIGYGIN